MSSNKILKRILSVTLGISMVASVIPVSCVANASTAVSLDEYEEIISTYSVDDETVNYQTYLAEHENAAKPSQAVEIDAADYVRTEEMEVTKLSNYEGMEGESLQTGDTGLIEYDVTVPETGFYDLSLLYYPIEGNHASIQRSVFLDGKLPYSEMALLEFSRIWINDVNEWGKDNQGNDLKPTQVEAPAWITGYCYDSNGYETSKLSLYLEAGKTHTITLVSLREPMVLRKLVLSNAEEVKDYASLSSTYDSSVPDYDGDTIEIQAEYANRKSSQMLYPQQDSTSPEVEPYDAKELLNNSIGGNSWRLVGQWLEWDFEVPSDGYYGITLHAKQSFVKGIYVSRKISIDGEVPFDEMNDYGFQYKQSWRMDSLSDAEGNPYKFYLTAGQHTMRMEAVLGDFSTIVSNVQDTVNKLNAIYRKVIRITGVAPDNYRDYQIEKTLPELEEELIVARDQMNAVIEELQSVAGKGSDKETVLLTMRDQLDDLIKDQERFSKILGSFKINVRACGNWITQVIEQPLALDSIYIHAPEKKIKQDNASALDKVVHEAKKLYYSFVIDYNQVGNIEEDGGDSETLTLWIGTGRDQASVIKNLIDSDFKEKTGVSVNVMSVDMSVLLQATLAGQGPDIAVQVNGSGAQVTTTTTSIYAGNSIPINYGIRNAVVDLSQFEDLPEIEKRFFESAMVPYRYNGGTYALPETETFLMMFYRKDILKELNMEIPKTWDEMKVALSVLSKNQMDLGMLPSEELFSMFLYQHGGTYYNSNGTKSALDSDESINAFKEYCEFYTDYTLDQETSVEERFRTGESPLIITDYTAYNNLAVSAPDIQGLWGMAPIPGVAKEDGTIDNTQGSVGSACMIMEACKNKTAAWEFLKWWTSADVQTSFDNEMESLMGAAARIATANIEAFGNLPWSNEEYRNLFEQASTVQGIPQVPGSYYTYRNVANAFYKVTTETDTTTPRESLMDKVILIDAEIEYKLEEFGLLDLKTQAED